MTDQRPTDENPVIDAILAKLWAGEVEVLMIDAYAHEPARGKRPPGYVTISERLGKYGVEWRNDYRGTWLKRNA